VKLRSNNCRRQLQCRKLRTPTVPRWTVLQSEIRLTLSKAKRTRREKSDAEKAHPNHSRHQGQCLGLFLPWKASLHLTAQPCARWQQNHHIPAGSTSVAASPSCRPALSSRHTHTTRLRAGASERPSHHHTTPSLRRVRRLQAGTAGSLAPEDAGSRDQSCACA